VRQKISAVDLLDRVSVVVRHEIDVTRYQLLRNNVEVIGAAASFVDDHTVRLDYPRRLGHPALLPRKTSSSAQARKPRAIRTSIDGKTILTSDDILHLDCLPHTLAVVGAGVVGCEYASMFAALGSASRWWTSGRGCCLRGPGNRRHAGLSPAGKPRHDAAERGRLDD